MEAISTDPGEPEWQNSDEPAMLDSGRSGTRVVENLLRPTLIAGMMVCLATPPVLVLELLQTDWDGTYFLVFCFLAGLEGILSERLLSRRDIAGWGYFTSRAAELVILLLLLKIANTTLGGQELLWDDLTNWSSGPTLPVSLIDWATWGMLVPLWLGAVSVARRVGQMDAGDDQEEPPEDRTSAAYYLWLTRRSSFRDREATLVWLGDTVVWGGIVMLVASAALYVALPDSGLPAVAIVLYFSLGVALLSQARFSVARAGWQTQGIRVQRGIGGRWLLWAAVFLVTVAAVALILPTMYLMGPALVIYNLILLVGRLLMYVLGLLFYGLAWLASRFAPDAAPPEPPVLSLTPVPASETAPAAAAPSWSGFLLTLVFWAVILAIIGFALLRVIRDRLAPLQGSQGPARLWGRFLAILASLWRSFRAWRREVQTALATRLPRRRPDGSRERLLPRFVSLGRLSPRDLVRYFYVSTVRRASQAGQPRHPSQTPYEYRELLGKSFADLEPDLSGLTDAFVRARYSPETVEKADAERAKPLWQRIKAALRRRRRRNPVEQQ